MAFLTKTIAPLQSKAAAEFPGIILQPKLEVSASHDPLEREADSIADKVANSATTIQRKCEACEKEELQKKPLINGRTLSSDSGKKINPRMEQQIRSSRGNGKSLPDETRSFLEKRMGANFREVRIHTDDMAIQMNRELGARAFTVGRDIYFNAAQYSPKSAEGQKLLAHELTHTLQQSASAQTSIQRKEIDYKTISWDDFKGPLPKQPQYDALTTSDIHDPKTADIKPKEPVITSTDAKCEGGGDKTYNAKIEYDTSKIEVKSFMDQDLSWKRAWTTEADAQETKCKNEFVTKCKTSFTSGETQAKKDADQDVKDCEKAASELKENQYLTYECEGKEVQVKKGECASKMKTCFEKQRIKNLTYEADNNAGDKFTVHSKAECDTKLLEACKKTLVPGMSRALLKHEQGHFDITNEVAKQIQKDLGSKADSLATEAEACSEEEAKTKAQKALADKKPAEEFEKIWTAGKKKLKDTQKAYDDETAHSTKVAEQGAWNEKIAAGEI